MQDFHKQGVLFSANRMWMCILRMFPRDVGVPKEWRYAPDKQGMNGG
jgi:hypothetical protein